MITYSVCSMEMRNHIEQMFTWILINSSKALFNRDIVTNKSRWQWLAIIIVPWRDEACHARLGPAAMEMALTRVSAVPTMLEWHISKEIARRSNTLARTHLLLPALASRSRVKLPAYFVLVDIVSIQIRFLKF